jgi:transglutaminase-like putative cysteine protease
MKLGKRAALTLLLAGVLLCLCACRAVRLPGGETFIIQKEQRGQSQPPAAPEITERAASVPTPEATPAAEEDGGAHYFVAQQDEAIRNLFWLIYHEIENFSTRIALPTGTTRAQVDLVDGLLYNDCPELFYLSHLSTYYYMQSAPDLITEVEVSYDMTRAEYEAAAPRIEAIVADWLRRTEGFSDYEKELFVHDAIIARCTYDNASDHTGSLYGTLILGRARCQGYANTMNYVMRRMGIPSLYLYGEAVSESGKESHAWNAVNLCGVWTLVDVTWDDPVGERETLSHAYFNLNDEMMSVSHTLAPDFPLGEVPQCESLTWNYCARQGNFVEAGQDAQAAAVQRLAEALRAGETRLAMQFGTREQCQSAVDNLQAILQEAANETGVYPTGTSYGVDPKANYLEFISITYD